MPAFAAFPRAHRRTIWSTNPVGQINEEIERRSRVEVDEQGRNLPCHLECEGSSAARVGSLWVDSVAACHEALRSFLDESGAPATSLASG